MLCHFCLFLSCVLGVFNNLMAIPAHGLSGFARVFDYDLYGTTRAGLLGIFVPPPTVPLH